eukprot:5273594-Ditylum_brightwellii.AAC.1
MTGETVLHTVREQKRVGIPDVMPYQHCQWAMDNWFTSMPLYDEMVQLGQYAFGTIEVKRYVPSFLKHGKTKKPTQAVPKGTVRAGTSVGGKLSI